MPTHKLGGYYLVTSHRFNHPAIFYDHQDYKVFEYYLYIYLAPLQSVLNRYPFLPPRLQQRNINQDLNLVAYRLSNNQIRFLVHLQWLSGINNLLSHLTSSYSQYLRLKYPHLSQQPQLTFTASEITEASLIPDIIQSIHRHTTSPPSFTHPWSSELDYKKGRFRPFLTKYHPHSKANHQHLVESPLDSYSSPQPTPSSQIDHASSHLSLISHNSRKNDRE